MLFEVTDVSELEPILRLTAGVDSSTEVVVLVKVPQTDRGGASDAFALTVLLTVIANRVKALQGEPRRIDPAVTNGTRFN